MKCLRCGYCCVASAVAIVSPSHVSENVDLDNVGVEFKRSYELCPHLKFENNEAVCTIHHYKWYKYTPCARHSQIEPQNSNCRLGIYFRAHTTNIKRHWEETCKAMVKIATLIFICLFSNFSYAQVIIKNDQAIQYNSNGSYQKQVGRSGAISSASSDQGSVVVYADGKACRYDSKGNYKGIVGTSGAVSAQIVGNTIIIKYRDGSNKRYDVKTGAYKGQF